MAHRTHEDHEHDHGPGCGHTAVRHDGCLHHPHGDHCDNHGRVELVTRAEVPMP